MPETAQGGADLRHIAEPLRALALPLDSLTLDPANARKHPEKNLAAIQGSLRRFGQRFPLVVQKEGMVVRAGNGRVMAARALGWTHMACVVVDESNVDAVSFAIADNRTGELAEWDDQTLADLLRSLPDDMRECAGFGEGDLAEVLGRLDPDGVAQPPPAKLADRFGVPPFSVLDARQGYWQDRKRQWLAIGIESELGRGGGTWVGSATGSPADRQRAYAER